MLNKNHYQALHKLEDGKATERREGLRLLMEMEGEGVIGESEVHQLLEYEDKSSIILYATQAAFRLKIDSAFEKLIELYKKTKNPVLVNTIVVSLTKMEKAHFKDIVLKKAREHEETNQTLFFDKEQLTLSVLKYLQKHAELKDLKFFLPYLKEKNSQIVFNTLLIFNKKNFPITNEQLESIQKHHKEKLLQEQVKIMLGENMKNPTYS